MESLGNLSERIYLKKKKDYWEISWECSHEEA